MSNRASAPVHWSSFHVYLPGGFDLFLVDHVAPLAAALAQHGHLKRFFFIRYGDDEGPHLRLRFQPRAPHAPDAIAERLRGAAHAFAVAHGFAPEACRVVPRPYDRTEHYFGETLVTVYAELLNEQTSYLALRLLRHDPSDWNRRAVMLMGTLALLLRRSCRDQAEAHTCLAHSVRFAVEAGQRFLPEAAPPTPQEIRFWHRAAAGAAPAVQRALAADPSATRSAWLLRRLRCCGEQGPFAATHALHLLCNKLGFDLRAERVFFEALSAVPTAQPHPPSPTPVTTP